MPEFYLDDAYVVKPNWKTVTLSANGNCLAGIGKRYFDGGYDWAVYGSVQSVDFAFPFARISVQPEFNIDPGTHIPPPPTPEDWQWMRWVVTTEIRGASVTQRTDWIWLTEEQWQGSWACTVELDCHLMGILSWQDMRNGFDPGIDVDAEQENPSPGLELNYSEYAILFPLVSRVSISANAVGLTDSRSVDVGEGAQLLDQPVVASIGVRGSGWRLPAGTWNVAAHISTSNGVAGQARAYSASEPVPGSQNHGTRSISVTAGNGVIDMTLSYSHGLFSYPDDETPAGGGATFKDYWCNQSYGNVKADLGYMWEGASAAQGTWTVIGDDTTPRETVIDGVHYYDWPEENRINLNSSTPIPTGGAWDVAWGFGNSGWAADYYRATSGPIEATTTEPGMHRHGGDGAGGIRTSPSPDTAPFLAQWRPEYTMGHRWRSGLRPYPDETRLGEPAHPPWEPYYQGLFCGDHSVYLYSDLLAMDDVLQISVPAPDTDYASPLVFADIGIGSGETTYDQPVLIESNHPVGEVEEFETNRYDLPDNAIRVRAYFEYWDSDEENWITYFYENGEPIHYMFPGNITNDWYPYDIDVTGGEFSLHAWTGYYGPERNGAKITVLRITTAAGGGWLGYNCTLSIEDGVLKAVATADNAYASLSREDGLAAQVWLCGRFAKVRWKASIDSAISALFLGPHAWDLKGGAADAWNETMIDLLRPTATIKTGDIQSVARFEKPGRLDYENGQWVHGREHPWDPAPEWDLPAGWGVSRLTSAELTMPLVGEPDVAMETAHPVGEVQYALTGAYTLPTGTTGVRLYFDRLETHPDWVIEVCLDGTPIHTIPTQDRQNEWYPAGENDYITAGPGSLTVRITTNGQGYDKYGAKITRLRVKYSSATYWWDRVKLHRKAASEGGFCRLYILPHQASWNRTRQLSDEAMEPLGYNSAYQRWYYGYIKGHLVIDGAVVATIMAGQIDDTQNRVSHYFPMLARNATAEPQRYKYQPLSSAYYETVNDFIWPLRDYAKRRTPFDNYWQSGHDAELATPGVSYSVVVGSYDNEALLRHMWVYGLKPGIYEPNASNVIKVGVRLPFNSIRYALCVQDAAAWSATIGRWRGCAYGVCWNEDGTPAGHQAVRVSTPNASPGHATNTIAVTNQLGWWVSPPLNTKGDGVFGADEVTHWLRNRYMAHVLATAEPYETSGPSLDKEPAGRIYLAYAISGDIYLERSDDYGEKWCDPVRVTSDAANDSPQITTTWVGRYQQLCLVYHKAGGNIVKRTSADEGATWTEEVVMVTGSHPYVYRDPTSDLKCLFYVSGGTLYVRRSMDNFATWLEDAQVVATDAADDVVCAQPAGGPEHKVLLVYVTTSGEIVKRFSAANGLPPYE